MPGNADPGTPMLPTDSNKAFVTKVQGLAHHSLIESRRQLTVQTVAELLRYKRHDLMRDSDEVGAEYAVCSELSGTHSTTPDTGDASGAPTKVIFVCLVCLPRAGGPAVPWPAPNTDPPARHSPSMMSRVADLSRGSPL